VGGILKDQLLGLADEICTLDFEDCTTSPLLTIQPPEAPRPLLIGVSVKDAGDSFLVAGGSAVCFSFGTFWNRGCYTISTRQEDCDHRGPTSVSIAPVRPWRLVDSVAAALPVLNLERIHPTDTSSQRLVVVSRAQINSPEQFDQVLQNAQPVILSQLNIGSCTSKWTTEYLKAKIGNERQVNLKTYYKLSRSYANIVGDCS
jgi:tRNA wybutosine-synthesizing protein 4